MSRTVDRLFGPVALGLVVLTVWLGLWVTPPDETQGDLVRLLYLHPALAWVALYLAFGLAALASALYLWPTDAGVEVGPARRLDRRGRRRVPHAHPRDRACSGGGRRGACGGPGTRA